MKRKLKKLIFHGINLMIVRPMAYLGFRRYHIHLFHSLLKFVGVDFSGEPRFIASNVHFDDFSKTHIGERVVLSEHVILLTHDYSYTTGLIAMGQTPPTDIGIVDDIRIGNNVFVGMSSILLPGTNIGDNVVVGAGSVLRGKVPSNSVVAGNPAQVICTIEKLVEKRQSIDSSKLNVDKL